MPVTKKIEVILGDSPKEPYLKSTDAILIKYEYQNRLLSLMLRGISSRENETIVISPQKPVSISLNNRLLTEGWSTDKADGWYMTEIRFRMTDSDDKLCVKF